MFVKEVLSNPDPSIPYCHCPTIVRMNGGELVVAWYAYPSDETRDGQLIVARKPPGASKFQGARRMLVALLNRCKRKL